MSKKAQVVLVGRMNVGKSTLFNRLTKHTKSITLDYEGVTRDYLKEEVEWGDTRLDLIDSGGIHLKKTDDVLFERIRTHVLALIEAADVVVFMVDGTVGVVQEDQQIAKFLHKLGKPVVLAINKIDSKQAQENEHEFVKLGFGEQVALTAEHGRGIPDLLDAVVRLIPQDVSAKAEPATSYRIMLLGKPNVGKSSLMNELMKQERALVSDIPGTTREAVSEKIMFYKEAIGITDTPGIRKKRAVTQELESLMVKSAFQAMRFSHIVLMLIDGSSPTLVDQELKLAFYAFKEQYKSLILIVNKSDLMTEESTAGLEMSFSYYRHLINKIPVLYISCKTGKNVGKVLPAVQQVWERTSQQLDQEAIQQLFFKALERKPLYHKRMPLVVYKARQLRYAPLTIQMRVNEPAWFGPSQLAFFENLLRSEYPMKGVPVKFILKKGKR